MNPVPPPPPKWRLGERERFELVKSITEKRLDFSDSLSADKDVLGKEIVALADAVLAAMDKPEAETPDAL